MRKRKEDDQVYMGTSVHAPETWPFSQTKARTTGSPSSWYPKPLLKQNAECRSQVSWQRQNAQPRSSFFRFPSLMVLQTRVCLKFLKTPLKRRYFLFSSKWTQPGQSQIYKQSSRNCLARSLLPYSLLRFQVPEAKWELQDLQTFFFLQTLETNTPSRTSSDDRVWD